MNAASGDTDVRRLTVRERESIEDLDSERARADRLDRQLQVALAEIAALRTARDAALKVAAWGGPRRIAGSTRHEHKAKRLSGVSATAPWRPHGLSLACELVSRSLEPPS